MHPHQRRRLVVATVFTVVAMPALWVLDRGEPGASSSPSVAAAGFPDPLPMADVPTVDTIAPEVPVFVDNTVQVVAPAVIDIARPASPTASAATGKASYKRYVDVALSNPCTTRLAPSGATVIVTNLDNGLATSCTNTLGVPVPSGAEIVIDTDLFLTIADLVDAPVPVRLSW